MSAKKTGVQTPKDDEARQSPDIQTSMTPESRRAALNELLALINSLPNIPWEGGDSPEDDKRILGERYMD